MSQVVQLSQGVQTGRVFNSAGRRRPGGHRRLVRTLAVVLSVWGGVGVVAAIGSADGFAAENPKAASEWNGANIAWRDYASGIAEATATRKPILLVAHTSWCPHCKRYSKLFQDAEVVSLSRRFVMIMIDRDREPELNARLGPDGATYIPRTLFLRADGTLRADVVGENRKYPNLVDTYNPLELLTVMSKALDTP